MVSRSCTVNAFRLSLTSAGASSGKKLSTLSVSFNLPSLTAKPTAVAVKVLLTEPISNSVSLLTGCFVVLDATPKL